MRSCIGASEHESSLLGEDEIAMALTLPRISKQDAHSSGAEKYLSTLGLFDVPKFPKKI